MVLWIVGLVVLLAISIVIAVKAKLPRWTVVPVALVLWRVVPIDTPFLGFWILCVAAFSVMVAVKLVKHMDMSKWLIAPVTIIVLPLFVLIVELARTAFGWTLLILVVGVPIYLCFRFVAGPSQREVKGS